MNKLKPGTVPAVLFLVLALLAGCKDLFHPDGPKADNNNTSTSTFTVTFDADGGDPPVQTRQINSGNSVGSSNMPSAAKSGHNFAEWYTQKDGGGTRFTGSTTVTGDITVYAKWAPITLGSPAGLNVTGQTANSVSLSWQTVSGATAYKIYKGPNSADVNEYVTETSLTSYTVTGLAPNTGYYFTVRAVSGSGESLPSAAVQGTTAAAALAAPAGLSVTGQTANSVSLSWQTVSGATAYKIYKGPNSADVNEYVTETSLTSYTVTGLAPNTGYYFAVSAVNGNGEESLPSAAVQGTTATAALAAPAGLSVTAKTQTSLTLSWQTVSGAEGYRVSRSTSSGGPFNLVQTTASTSCNDNTGLTAGTTYYYRVTAYSGQNESGAATVSGTTVSGEGTIPLPPAKPAGLVVSGVTSGSVTLLWNSVANADSYDIYRGNTKDITPSKIGSSGTQTSWTDSSAGAGVMRYYSVRAVNSSGGSPYSDKAFAVASAHYALPTYTSSYPLNLPAGSKHYYRLAVTAGQTYSITWENGSSQNVSSSVGCSAWQNDGTAIFTNAYYNGYTSPKVFTAAAAGYVTVEVKNDSNSTGYDYKIYYN